jgi:23S rRNA pseudouridine1911/1915/1917 synthase
MRGSPRLPSAGRRLVIDLPHTRRGERLDRILASLLPGHSRAALQRLIREGHVRQEQRPVRASYKARGGERIVVELPAPLPSSLAAEDLPLVILHEDPDLLVLNKPPGMVVHPGAGATRGTLVNALLHHCRDLSGVGGTLRPGIVHRLDRDTSGVLVVAKNDESHRSLAAQFKSRAVRKTYEALVWGHPRPTEGTIDSPIGRHPSARVRMAVRPGGRPALTRYRIEANYGAVSLLEVHPETGRTHQIRVHMQALGCPIVGDRLYGGLRGRPAARGDLVRILVSDYGGLALHARRLAFAHPRGGARCEFEAPRPTALETLIEELSRLVVGSSSHGAKRS